MTEEELVDVDTARQLIDKGYPVPSRNPYELARIIAEKRKVINNTEQKVAPTTSVPKHNN